MPVMESLTHGVYPAIVTPFDENGDVDYDAFAENIHRLEEQGVDGIVPCGSTGERPTIRPREHEEIIEFASEEASKPVIVGTGSPSTERTVELTKHAEDAGADGALIIGPYYSSPSDPGLIRHHREIADATDLPLLLYNHPEGMGFNLSPDVVTELSTHPNIVGVKESSGNVEQVNELCNRTSDTDFDVMIGWDSLLLPAMSVGATGIVGTCSNVIPRDIKALWELAKEDRYSEALDLHQRVSSFEQDLLIEHPSITVKYVMSLLGYVDPYVREPQYPLDSDKKDELEATLKEYQQDSMTHL
jgi:4-hydroxy-tetrahydrodipicolinate synthase